MPKATSSLYVKELHELSIKLNQAFAPPAPGAPAAPLNIDWSSVLTTLAQMISLLAKSLGPPAS